MKKIEELMARKENFNTKDDAILGQRKGIASNSVEAYNKKMVVSKRENGMVGYRFFSKAFYAGCWMISEGFKIRFCSDFVVLETERLKKNRNQLRQT